MAARRKRKEPAAVAPSSGSAITVPRIHVRVVTEPTEHEGGTDGGMYGDVLVNGYCQGTRYTVAQKLRELAEYIAGTVGDPVHSASITVLMTRAK